MSFEIPESIKKAMKIMRDGGFECYLVGGCVRDFLMGKTPADFDITTNARPEQTEKCFEGFKVVETGIKHGTVTVIVDDEPIEITTYRIDGEYKDNRRPESVSFTGELSEDLSRRDFTVNALAYSGEGDMVDLFSGREDLEKKIIRCVGEPDLRFNEDGLRILRALRFASVLDFDIEEKTAESVRKNKDLLFNISRERIYTELTKLLCGVNAQKILLEYREVLEVCIPQLKKVENYGECIKAVAKSPYRKEVRYGAFLIHSESPKEVMQSLKCDNNTRDEVSDICRLVKVGLNLDEMSLKKNLIKYSFKTLENAVCLLESFGADKNECERARELLVKIEERGDCVSLDKLDISGRDIISENIAKGKDIGIILNQLLIEVVENKTENKREILIKRAKELMKV